MRLIDADAFIEEAQKRIDMQDMYLPVHIKELVLDEMPTVDAEPVIRCKDCKWLGKSGCAVLIVDESDKPKEDDFCSWAERKEK